MNEPIATFYDRLAVDYHFIFEDWDRSVVRQGDVLDRLIRAEADAPPTTVLDCSCGIGTQAIGLAQRGYRVHATDLSPASVARARHEAERLGAELTFGVADLRALAAQVEGTFDVVLTCDNPLPHLLTDDELRRAAHGMAAKVRPGGLLLASIRDYDRIVRDRPRVEAPRVIDGPEGRRVVFQVWDWAEDGRSYRLGLFIVRQEGGGWETIHHAAVYRPLLRVELGRALSAAGLSGVRWHPPEATGYHQPIVTVRKGEGGITVG